MKRTAAILAMLALCACHSRAEVRHKFYTECFAAKFTKAQCKFYWRMQAQSIAATDAANTAVGLSAISLGMSAGKR